MSMRDIASWVRHPRRMPTKAPQLVCVCRHPRPRQVALFGTILLRDAYECETCGRPIITRRE